MQRRWTNEDLMQLGFLIQAGFNNREISEVLNKSLAAVQIKAKKAYGGNKNYRVAQIKHKHLREPIFRYFLKHNWEETREKFKLTDSELKSVFTVGYRDPKLAHLRKDKRVKSPWTTNQLKILLQSAGLKPRSWVAKKLKRGNVHSCIKERLERLGVSTRTLNGVTMTSYIAMFGKRPRVFLKTNAGPTRGKYAGSTYFRIIPWYQIEKDFKEGHIKTTNDPFKKAAKTMLLFQNWIFDGDAMKHLKKLEVSA